MFPVSQRILQSRDHPCRRAETIFTTSTGILQPKLPQPKRLEFPPLLEATASPKYPPVKPQTSSSPPRGTGSFNRLYYGAPTVGRDVESAGRSSKKKLPQARLESLLQRLSQMPRRLPHRGLRERTEHETMVLGGVLDGRPQPYDAKRDTHLALFWARREILQSRRVRSPDRRAAGYEQVHQLPASESAAAGHDHYSSDSSESTPSRQEPRRLHDQEAGSPQSSSGSRHPSPKQADTVPQSHIRQEPSDSQPPRRRRSTANADVIARDVPEAPLAERLKSSSGHDSPTEDNREGSSVVETRNVGSTLPASNDFGRAEVSVALSGDSQVLRHTAPVTANLSKKKQRKNANQPRKRVSDSHQRQSSEETPSDAAPHKNETGGEYSDDFDS